MGRREFRDRLAVSCGCARTTGEQSLERLDNLVEDGHLEAQRMDVEPLGT
jgi:hypothetical protein